jgi:Uma2 family endonuclease
MEALKLEEEYYTYADMQEWETKPDERWEIIDGIAYMMAGPNLHQQSISMELSLQIGVFLRGKPCRVLAAPFDVRLFPEEDDSDDTCVQPDLIVVCDAAQLDDGKACKGPPSLVIEIISPSSRSMDVLYKFNKYKEAGVREYWVIDPEAASVHVYSLADGKYFATCYGLEDKTLEVGVLPGCVIDIEALFAAIINETAKQA